MPAKASAAATRANKQGKSASRRAVDRPSEPAPDPAEKGRKPAKAEGKSKRKKDGKVVRDSFTMPVQEYEMIAALKKRCLGLGMAVKKSEFLRAGLAMVAELPDERLTQVVAVLDSVKTGRPPKKGKKKAAAVA